MRKCIDIWVKIVISTWLVHKGAITFKVPTWLKNPLQVEQKQQVKFMVITNANIRRHFSQITNTCLSSSKSLYSQSNLEDEDYEEFLIKERLIWIIYWSKAFGIFLFKLIPKQVLYYIHVIPYIFGFFNH